jgi:endo-1,4-beta-D-glucanase Y
MLLKLKTAAVLLLVSSAFVFAQNPQRPFPQANYNQMEERVIRPTNRTPDQLNLDVVASFNRYRTFLRTGTGAHSNMSWIYAQGTGFAATNTITISEAHGYGMIIFALMAGHDSEARAVFDRMNNFRIAHPSPTDNRLMAWFIRTPGQVPNVPGPDGERANSATDGDLDMAYALLLADTQWGSNPAADHAQNYLAQAQRIIQGIRESNMHTNNQRTKLGDWHARNWNNNTPGIDSRIESRSSDWRPSHFRAFARAMGEPGSEQHTYWMNAANNVHTILGQASNQTTGLMPDFVSGSPAIAEPTPAVSGEHNMDRYAYNACRVPLYLALDYAHYGTVPAMNRMNTISTWLRGATNSNANQIRTMRHLNGSLVNASSEYNSVIFTAPFASAMTADLANLSFLNSTFDATRNTSNDWAYNAYASAIQVLNMLFITRNWWAPGSVGEFVDPGNGDYQEITNYALRQWSDYGGNIGSSSNVTTNNQQAGILEFSMTINAEDPDIDHWTGIGTYFDAGDEGNFATATKIEIVYTLSRDATISFGGTDGGASGCNYFFTIPASITETTLLIDISGFARPAWGDYCPSSPLNVDGITGVMINAIAVEGETVTTNGRITSMKLVSGGGTSIVIPQTARNRTQSSGAINIAKNRVNLNIPSEKAVTMRISDVRGRVLLSREINLNSGNASFDIPSSMNNQVLILNVQGKNGVNLSRKMLLR